MTYLIHVEKVWDKQIWDNLLSLIKKDGQRCHLFLMAPQLDLQKSVHGYTGTNEELSEELAEKYTYLKKIQPKYRFKIAYHVHISLQPEKMSEEPKKKLFEDGLTWVRNIFPEINSVCFGWYKYDSYLKKLCDENGIKIVHFTPFAINLHDYDLTENSYTRKPFRLVRSKLRTLTYWWDLK